MKSLSRLAWGICVAAAALSGCAAAVRTNGEDAADDGAAGDAAAGLEGGVAVAHGCENYSDSASAVVGPEGGTLAATRANVTLTIPPGALRSATRVTVDVCLQSVPAYSSFSALVMVSPRGLRLERSASVRIFAGGALAGDPLWWLRADGSGYERVGAITSGGLADGAIEVFTQGFVGSQDTRGAGDGGEPVDAAGD